MAHCGKEFRLLAIGSGSSCPLFLCLADRCAQLFVGKSEFVRKLARFVLLVLELTGLRLEQRVALFQSGDARSFRVTQSGHSDSANYRAYFRKGEWHFRARTSGYCIDDFLQLSSTKVPATRRYVSRQGFNAHL